MKLVYEIAIGMLDVLACGFAFALMCNKESRSEPYLIAGCFLTAAAIILLAL